MYTYTNFKSKKAFKEAVKNGEEVRIFSPGPFPPASNGIEYVEGPHAPEPHKWYAKVVLKDGVVIKVT